MKEKSLYTGIILLLSTMLFIASDFSAIPENQPRKPDIFLIVADDLAYSDLGSYGGEINTPHLDFLAAHGIKFSRFHTAPFCAVSRAMILSGNNNHIAGMGSQDLKTGIEGYEGRLSDRIISLPSLLRDHGYHTYMAGKWHLGTTPEANPHQKGFEHSFVTLAGGANHYSNKGIFPNVEISQYTEDGVKTDWKEGDYSTDFYTDKLISYIDRHKDDGQPFFAFAAYTSPHWPLQVDEKYWKKYMGKYDEGYEDLKKVRFENLKRKGLIPEIAIMPPSHPSVRPWDSLTINEKRKESRKMEIYAGMVDNLDENIGRLINHLKDIGRYENTLFVFISDNGAAAEDFYYHDYFGPFLKQHYSDDYETMGKPESFISYGPQWAEAGASPFKYFKGYTTEGGMVAPMIIAGPLMNNSSKTSHAFTTMMDLAPTFYEMAGITYPSEFKGKQVHPLMGTSLLPILKGVEEIHDENEVFGLEHRNYAMIRKGKWKIVQIERPFNIDHFSLYDLSNDLAEQHDLKDTYPDVYKEMIAEWEEFSKKVKVKIPTPAQGEGL